MQPIVDMIFKNHNISKPAAIFLVACASFIFFLPTAISMNAPAPTVTADGIAAANHKPWAMESLHDVGIKAGIADNLAGQHADPQKSISLDGDASEIRNKKGNLQLKTAAAIGASSAVAAAFLAGEGAK
jgi:hypothetical protein